jgi:hypothetical protein
MNDTKTIKAKLIARFPGRRVRVCKVDGAAGIEARGIRVYLPRDVLKDAGTRAEAIAICGEGGRLETGLGASNENVRRILAGASWFKFEESYEGE